MKYFYKKVSLRFSQNQIKKVSKNDEKNGIFFQYIRTGSKGGHVINTMLVTLSVCIARNIDTITLLICCSPVKTNLLRSSS